MNTASHRLHNSQAETISFVKTALRRWGVLAFFLGVLSAGGGIAATLLLWEPVYDAKQFVRIRQNREFADILDDQNNKIDPKSVLAPVKSEPLLNRVLLIEDVRKHPEIDLNQLTRMVRYEPSGGEYYAIICRHRSSVFAALVVNHVTHAFVDDDKAYRDSSLAKLNETVAEEVVQAELDIKNIAQQLADLNAQRIISSAIDKQPIDPNGELLAEMLKTRFNRQLEKKQLSNELQNLQQSLATTNIQVDETSIVPLVKQSSQLLGIDQELQALKGQRRQLLQLGDNHPDVRAIQIQIDQKQQNRDQTFNLLLEARKTALLEERKREFENEMADSIQEIERRIARIDLEIIDIDRQVEKLSQELRNTNRLDFEFDQLLMKQQRAFENLDRWLARQDRIDSKDMSLYQVAITGQDPVAPPTEPVEVYPWKLLGLVTAGGLLLPFALAVAWEFRLRRISSPEQIKLHCTAELLGEVANLPSYIGRPKLLSSRRVTKQLRLYEESVDNLSAILVHTAGRKPQILSVTSAASNEGKTTLASQLAISAARSNRGKTLLIDADLRAPSLHRLFEATLDVGLADVLAQSESLVNAVAKTRIDNLYVMTAGKLRSAPRRYFSDEQWENLLSEARLQYDQIIVDTPPVLAASESLAVSKECDCTLICVLRDVSRSDSVKRAHDRLVAADVNVLGCVFGGVPQNEYFSRYGSYHYNLA